MKTTSAASLRACNLSTHTQPTTHTPSILASAFQNPLPFSCFRTN